jgi:hypothetical protein
MELRWAAYEQATHVCHRFLAGPYGPSHHEAFPGIVTLWPTASPQPLLAAGALTASGGEVERLKRRSRFL